MAKNLNLLSTRQKQELAKTGSFSTSKGKNYTPTQQETDAYRETTPEKRPPVQSTPTPEPISTPVEAEMVQPATEVELPEPQAPAVQEAFFGSIAENVQTSRAEYEQSLQTRRDEIAADSERITAERDALLEGGVQENLQPFREQLEKNERERLYVNENFEANQRLTNELDTLLTEGNNLIKQMQGIPAANRIVNARVTNAMRDVSARAGVIQAVMSARNSQISQAYTMIDRTTEAIVADRNDQLTYFGALLDVKEKGLLSLSAEDEKLANEQLELARGDVDRAQETADYIKSLMIDPETAQFVADAGVTMLDSVETINQKLGQETTRIQVQDTKNAYVEAGYEYVPFPSEGDTGLLQVEVNGQTLNFRVRPGSQLALDIEQQKADLASTRALTAQRYTSRLLDLASVGDPSAIAELGFDPRDVSALTGLTVEEVTQTEQGIVETEQSQSVIDELLANERGIGALTGQLQNPTISGFFQGGKAGEPGQFDVSGLTRFIPGVGNIQGSIQSRNDRDSALASLQYIYTTEGFQEFIGFKQSGLTFGALTEGERKTIFSAANRLNAALVVDQESGRISGYQGTESELRRDLELVNQGLQARQDELNTKLALTPEERKEIINLR